VNASLDDAQIETVIARVQELISKNDGEVKGVNRWGRRRLAYSIQKKNNGYFVCIEYVGTGDIVSKLDRHFRLEENVLRYLTVVVPKQVLKARELPATDAGAATVEVESPTSTRL